MAETHPGGNVHASPIGRPVPGGFLRRDRTGDNSAGNGGDGNFYGGLVHATFAFYYPINIAVAGYNSSAHAEQTTTWCSINPRFRWPASAAMAGTAMPRPAEAADMFSSIFGSIGSDVIATGHNSAGNGGDGHFSGSLVDINVAIYAPINIAVAGYNSTAEAHSEQPRPVRSERDPDRRRRW